MSLIEILAWFCVSCLGLTIGWLLVDHWIAVEERREDAQRQKLLRIMSASSESRKKR
jgi:hypothetical protein